MKTLLVGDCKDGNVLTQSDPDSPLEAEFEGHVAHVLACLYRRYQCVIFTGTFQYDDRGYRPDLALVARDRSHWFIVEVELVAHSLDRHVLPQVRAFRYGHPQADCAGILAREIGISREQAETLVHYVPRSVVVVANKPDPTWQAKLSALEVQMASVAVYGGSGGRIAYEMDGTLHVTQENLGFGRYSATDRSLRFPVAVRLPRGRVQIDDPKGGLGWWTVVEERNEVWVTKESGSPEIADRMMVQILRSYDGRLVIRRPR